MIGPGIRKIQLSQKPSSDESIAFPFIGFGLGDRIVFEVVIRNYRQQHPEHYVIGVEQEGMMPSMRDYSNPPDEIWVVPVEWHLDRLKSCLTQMLIEANISQIRIFKLFMHSWFIECNAIRRQFRLFEVLNQLSKQGDYSTLIVPKQDLYWAQFFLLQHRIPENSPIVAIHIRNYHNHPGQDKNMDFRKYSTLIDMLIEKHNAVCIVVGKDEDNAKIEKKGVIDVSKSSLGLWSTAALIKLSDLYIGTDTGPTHIAAAVGTPIIAVDYPDIHLGPFAPSEKCLKLIKSEYPTDISGYAGIPLNEIYQAAKNMLNH